jgi:hypothetical protein
MYRRAARFICADVSEEHIYRDFPKEGSYILFLVYWQCSPSNLQATQQYIFFMDWGRTPRPSPNLENRGIPFSLGYHLWPVWHGRPYADVCVTVRVI